MKTELRSVAIGLALSGSLLPSSGAQSPQVRFLDADRQPLPFSSHREIVDFLRSASEISSERLSEGITRAKRILLSRGGIEVHGIFHDIDRSEQKVKRLPNGNVVMYLRDSYQSQIAAYVLSRMLAMDNVPPTVLRDSGGIRGSLQLWIENAMTEEARSRRDLSPPDQTLWNQLYADMRVFDNLINNIDRNQGNMLVDEQWHLWLIDHTRSFGRDTSLPSPEAVSRCSRRLWQALQALTESELERRLSAYLVPAELRALFSRRDELIGLIESRVTERGEEHVLFDYGDPEPGIRIEYDGASAETSSLQPSGAR